MDLTGESLSKEKGIINLDTLRENFKRVIVSEFDWGGGGKRLCNGKFQWSRGSMHD